MDAQSCQGILGNLYDGLYIVDRDRKYSPSGITGAAAICVPGQVNPPGVPLWEPVDVPGGPTKPINC